MWRAIVVAAGLSMCLLGGEFMVVDRVVLADTTERPGDGIDSVYRSSSPLYNDSLIGRAVARTSGRRVFVPPEWAPWGLLSAGVLTVLYGVAIPRQ